MQTIKIDINKVTEEQVDFIAGYLKRGQVIAYPTDTVYGLGCDASNELAIKKIKKIKNQQNKKPMLVLVSSFKMLEKYCLVNAEQMEYLKKVWPESKPPLSSSPPIWRAGFVRRGTNANPPHPPLQGGRDKGAESRPVTVILENRNNLPVELTGGLNSLAVRLPKSEFLIKIICQGGFPIVSTSLNKTGQPPLNNVKNLEKYFEHLPDLAVDAGECERAKPSRLVDLRDIKNIRVIRK